jgi:Protein of unknown function (DUF3570)
MSASKRPSPSLTLLLAASAALGGQRSVRADETGSTQSVGYRFNVYDEDAFSGQPVIGSPERYHVDSQQLALNTGVGDRNTLNVDATHEVMSGSSPWYVVPGPGNKPVQVLSGATIHDHRSAVQAGLTHDAGANDTTSVSASYSAERDYHATSIGAEHTTPVDAALTFAYGGSLSHDLIRPTDAELYDRIASAQKNTLSGFGGLTWVLNKAAVVESGIQINYQTGYLADPYKLATVGDTQLPDTRPDKRTEGAWLVRYRYAVNGDAALHADARVAANSWGQHSVALEFSWYQSLGGDWQLVPGLRYYSQDAARFYAPFFAADSGAYYSSDYRLGAFGAAAANLNVRKRFGHWEFTAGAERYHSSTSYSLGSSSVPDPAIVSYTRAYAGLDFHFD